VYPYNGNNWYGIALLNMGGDGGLPGMSVAQANAIDQKLDDGFPTTGNVRAMTVSCWPNETWPSLNSAPNAANDNATTCFNNTTNNYSMSQNGGSNLNCALSFRMQGAAR